VSSRPPALAAPRAFAATVVATRAQLFFGLFLLATLNGFVGVAVRAVEQSGLTRAAANLFEISAILWVALAAGLAILWHDRDETPLRRSDLAVAAALLAAALFPAPTASSAALAFAAGWAIFTSPAGSPLRRAGIIFLAITGALIWGRLMLAMFSRPLLDIDAWFVSQLLGSGHSGNMIWSDGIRLLVAPGCSSMQGMSLAIVFWATVNQYFEVRFDRRAALTCLAALAATIAVNVLRIGSMLNWPQHLAEIHHGWGLQIASWTTLILVVGICLFGARREIFDAR
jgi:exosortase/archaeosortase family protein